MTEHPDSQQMARAKTARAVLELAGLDVHKRGRQPDQGKAGAVVGPTMDGWKVTIDLAAFDRLVAPLLRAAIDHPEIRAEAEYRTEP